MARKARARKASSSSGLVQTVADTISAHPRMSAAVAFELGILLGQLVNQRDATLRAVKRAPASVAAAMPSLSLFGNRSGSTASGQKTARRRRGGRGRKTASRRKK